MKRAAVMAVSLIPFGIVNLVEGEVITVESGFHHVRNAEPREWSHYPDKAERRRLGVRFDLENPSSFVLLTLRQKGTKQTWRVSLNEKPIGTLLRDHNHLDYGIALPDGLLRERGNHLEIFTTSTVPDDIEVGDIALHTSQFVIEPEVASRLQKNRGYRRAVPDLKGRLSLRGIDKETSRPVPCRFTIVDRETGALAFLGAESNDRLAIREGVVYSLDGEATVLVDREKTYDVYCGRGFEYSLSHARVANVDRVDLKLTIKREVDTPGMVACDTHLHAFEYDRHGDCTLTERLISIAGEGIEFPISTAHDKHIDFTGEAARIGADRWFTPVVGCEVTTSLGHFNSFPVDPEAPPAAHKLRDWDRIFENIFATPGVRGCILNHGRDVHRNYTPLGPDNFDQGTGRFFHDRKLLANGIEIINSGATQTDPMQLVNDWFSLMLSGHKIAAVGSSDSHTVNFAIPGQGRTYLRVPDDADPSRIDVDAAIESFLSGQTWVSFGLMTTLEVSDDGRISAAVVGPSWVAADRLRIFRNRELIRDITIDPEVGERVPVSIFDQSDNGGRKFAVTFAAPVPLRKGDFLCAVATGPGIEEAWWPMMPPYQPDSPVLEPYVFGMSPAVWIR